MADLRSSDILAYDWANRAREILDAYKKNPEAKKAPEITLPDPDSIRETEMDPDSVAASILLGEGTGSIPADLAIGLTGGAAGPITEAVGGKSGVLDWIPGGSLLKAGVAAAPVIAKSAAKKFSNQSTKELFAQLNELADRWIFATAEDGKNPNDVWYKLPLKEKRDFLRLNGISPKEVHTFTKDISYRYKIHNSNRVEDMLGRDIAELAPDKKEYFSPYMVSVEPPGGAASRILGSVATDEPQVVEAVAEEVVDNAKKSKYKELLANAGAMRETNSKKRAANNAASKKSYAKKKVENEAANTESIKQEWKDYKQSLTKAESAKAAEAAAREARMVETPGGKWDWTEHPLGENGFKNRNLNYESLLGPDATPKERRAAYVLDSLASVAAREIAPKGVDNPKLSWKARQHGKTTYDSAGKRLLDDIDKNIKTGNLPISGKFSTEKINVPSMGGLHTGVLLETGDNEMERIYDLLFKPRAYKKVEEILKRTK